MPQYRTKPFNIPFYDSRRRGSYRVKVRVNKSTSNSVAKQEIAPKYFITHYFPEFYAFLEDPAVFATFENANETVAQALYDDIAAKVRIHNRYETAPPSNKRIIIFSLDGFDIDARRQQLEDDGEMPSFAENLAYFNEQENKGETISESTFVVGSLGLTNDLLKNGLRTFNTQFLGFEGQINLNVDFNGLQNGTQKILNLIVTILSQQLKTETPSYDFNEADTITLFFGRDDRRDTLTITGIQYLLVEESIQSQPMKIGYLSAVKYNKLLQDPLTLAVLRDYKSILDSVQAGSNTNTSYSWFDFMSSSGFRNEIDGQSLQIDLSSFRLDPKKDMQNVLISVASEFGLIETNNVEQLEKGFTTSMTSEEVKRLKDDVANNPDVYKRVFAQQSAKVLNTATKVSDVIGAVLDTGPIGFIDKANPKIGYILRQFGIQDLAREAFLCATFGINFEVGRINKAVRNSLIKTSSSIYYPPDLPRAAPISYPPSPIDGIPKFTISGEIWKQVLKLFVDALQEGVLQIISGLADMLEQYCSINNPRANDYGATDLASLISPTSLPMVGGGSRLDNFAAKNGMTTDELVQYIRDLSSILSSIEICILFTARDEAPEELIDRIIDYNIEYSNPSVSQALTTVTAVLGFFQDMSAIVDIVQFCDDIANELLELNQDNVCLTADDLADAGLDELLDLIENGLRLDPPAPNFDCPDKANFLRDPTVTKSIPETFNILTQTVEMQFVYAGSAVKSILLEPTVTSNDSANVLGNYRNAGLEQDELNEINNELLAPIISVFNAISTIDVNDCPVNIEDILPPELADVVGASDQALEVISDTVSSPEFINAVNSLTAKLDNISDQNAGGGPAFASYAFNQQFLSELRDYIVGEDIRDALPGGMTMTQLEIPTEFNSMKKDIDGTDALRIYFNFPNIPAAGLPVLEESSMPPAWSADQFLSVRYPSFDTEVTAENDWVPVEANLSELLSTDIEESLEFDLGATFASPVTSDTMRDFVTSVISSGAGDPYFVQYVLFPKAYAALVDDMFEYVIDNGIFDAATLQSLNFFHLNDNCPPAEVADFLDVNGILEQVQNEYKQSACNDEDMTRSTRISNSIQMGMYLLLIQVHIAEFVMKNIFVFSAFDITDLFANDFIRVFLRQQVTNSVLAYLRLEGGNLQVRRKLVQYFNMKIARPAVAEQGGIKFADGTIAFPTGTTFTTLDDTENPGFAEIIDFLISDRLIISALPVNNAIRKSIPDNQRKQIKLTEALLSAINVYSVNLDTQAVLLESIATYPLEAFENGYKVFMTARDFTKGFSNTMARRYKLWFYWTNSEGEARLAELATLGNRTLPAST
tara:strand:- start:825 stop:4829 length:4005 start_codon:yes stop_codon:yes gene_type:complete